MGIANYRKTVIELKLKYIAAVKRGDFRRILTKLDRRTGERSDSKDRKNRYGISNTKGLVEKGTQYIGIMELNIEIKKLKKQKKEIVG